MHLAMHWTWISVLSLSAKHTQFVSSKRAPALTSNSCGISRRARYSLASLVFISRRKSSEMTTSPKRLIFFSFLQTTRCSNLWLITELRTDSRSAHFCLLFVLYNWIPAGNSTAPPSSLADADAWLVRLPFYSGLLPARTDCLCVCVYVPWRWVGTEVARRVPKSARTASALHFQSFLLSLESWCWFMINSIVGYKMMV